MSQLNERLRDAADQHNALLTELSATDGAAASLKDNSTFIDDLKAQIDSTDRELRRLHNITEDGRKDHLKYHDSNVKRWIYKLQGSKGSEKFANKQDKEEREFHEAWQIERSTQETREELGKTLHKAENDRMRIEGDVQRHEKAQEQLDALYEKVFSGHTPEVPAEDRLKQAVHQSEEHRQQSESQLEKDRLALQFLQKAESCMKSATYNVSSALANSYADLARRGMFADMNARDNLRVTRNLITLTSQHVTDARKHQPAIEELGEVEVDGGPKWGDMCLDTLSMDAEQNMKILGSRDVVVRAADVLKGQLREQKRRVTEGEGRVKETGLAVEAARKELRVVRREIFDRVMSGRGYSDGSERMPEAPPPYPAA